MASAAPPRAQRSGAMLLLHYCIWALVTTVAEGVLDSEDGEEFIFASERKLATACRDGEGSFAVQALCDFISRNPSNTNETITSYYIFSFDQFCPTESDWFTLTIKYNAFSDVDWSLQQLSDIQSALPIMNLTSTRSPSWAKFFNNADSLVFRVERCLVPGPQYALSIFHGDDPTQLYEMTNNGIPIVNGTDISDIEFVTFDSVGPIFVQVAPSPPVESPLSTTASPTIPSFEVLLPVTTPVPTPSQIINAPKESSGSAPNSAVVDPAPTPAPSSSGVSCFSGSTKVDVKDKGSTKMSHLNIGDEIAVGSEGIYELVYSFGHYEPMGQAIFLEISTSQTSLRVSRDHLVFVYDQTSWAVPAGQVSVGDCLVLGENGATVVESIKTVLVQDGLYAPFTPSGKLLVNDGLLVSAFIAFNVTSTESSVGVFGVSYQWLAHSFEFPHRVFCYYFGKCPGESYTSEGLSEWVASPLEVAVWILKLEPSLSKNLLFASIVSLGLIFNGVELLLFLHPYAMLMLVGLWFSARLTTRKIF